MTNGLGWLVKGLTEIMPQDDTEVRLFKLRPR